ncbi:hypothetical protein Dimus_017151 [Dionaea muscipula]
MSKPNFPASPPPPQPPPLPWPSQPQPPLLRRAAPLQKQRTWSPDTYRDEAWIRKKDRRNRRTKSVTDEDLDELKACVELGFGFDSDSPVPDKRLSDTFPALGFYYAVNKRYYDTVSKPPPPSSSESDFPSPVGSPDTIFSPGEFVLLHYSSLLCFLINIALADSTILA